MSETKAHVTATSEMDVRRRHWSRHIVQWLGFILVVLFGLFLELETGKFMNPENFINLLHHSAVLGLLALGLTFVVITGEFDLGLANLNAFTGLVVAYLLIAFGWQTWSAVGVTLLVGMALNAGVGYLVGYRQYLSIAVTIASANIYLGMAYLISEGQPIRGNLPEAFRVVGAGTTLGLPNPVWVLVLCYCVGYFVLYGHKVGYYLYAIGGNAEAAKTAGVTVRRLKMMTFIISGGLAALGACLNTSWIGSGQPRVGPGYTLPMFAAVFFGIAIEGGRATLLGSLQGVLLLAVLNNGTALLGTQEFVNQMLIGGLLLVSVLVARWPAIWVRWRPRPTARA